MDNVISKIPSYLKIYNLHSDQWNLWQLGSQEDHCKDIFKRMCLCRLIFINWKFFVYLCVYVYIVNRKKNTQYERCEFQFYLGTILRTTAQKEAFRICSKLCPICVCVYIERILTKKYTRSSIHLDRRLLLVTRNRYLS